MKNRYNRVMEKIEVTPEMSKRILRNISETDFEIQSTKTTVFRHYKKILSIAACFVVLLSGAFIIPHIINSPTEHLNQIIPDIKTYNSVKELSSAVGFDVKEPSYLPFEATQRTYTAFWKELAEITYSNGENTIVFRMAQGEEDVSGSYNEYTGIKECIVDSYSVTLKGDNGTYNLAVWTNGDFSYSLQTIEPLSKEELLDIVLSMK